MFIYCAGIVYYIKKLKTKVNLNIRINCSLLIVDLIYNILFGFLYKL